MTGIIFFQTQQREEIVQFYRDQLGMEIWLEQEAGCTILSRGNFLVGFCDGDSSDTEGIITIVVDDQETVDELADTLGPAVEKPPATNEAFDIYQCFATDPEGRTVEVQTFLHPVPPVDGNTP